ncbi:MAG: LssY C-terminal domain-containing protein, partial [Proteobacteria bacterium]|nr:LssY C-terminal domain-containing protein [Pseudomonadota bacterium]
GGFFLLARAVGSGATAKADLMAVRFLEAFRSPGILEFFWRITLAGRWPLAVGIAGFATVLLLARGRRGFVLPLWAAMGLTQLSSALAKIHYARPRPPTAFYEVSSLSFPSGHASAAAALYGFLAISWVLTRKTGRVPAVLLAALAMALMGFSRLVLGVHYPSDVLGGFLVGLFWVTAAGGLAASPAWRRRWETPSRGMGKTRAWLAVGAAGAALFAMGAWYQASRPLPPPPRPVLALHFIQDLGPETLEQSGLTHWVRFLGNAPPRPMNLLVLIPETLTVENAFVRAGWVVTDPMNAKNMTRMIQSSAREEPYCGAPVLPAFWDSRAQDLAVGIRREGEPPLERHVARLWNTGMILDSHTVWAGLVESSPCTTQALAGETGDDPDAERDLAVRSLEQAFAEAEIRFLPLVAGGEARAAVIRLP